jgi:hypothetical protein
MEVEHKINRLSKLMNESQNREMLSQIKDFMNHNGDLSNFNYHDIENMILYPKIRQYGLKIEIKYRKLLVINIDSKQKRKTPRGNTDKNNTIFRFSRFLKETMLKKIELKIKETDPTFSLNSNLDKTMKYLIQTGILTEIDHYSVWINNNIYHWGPDYKQWIIYGEDETSREIVNEWEKDNEYPNTYFTLRTLEEINGFCDKYKNTKYDYYNNNSNNFKELFIKYLGI